MSAPYRIAILGGGAWGTALAAALRRTGVEVALWLRDPAQADSIRQGSNPRYLPGISLPEGIAATNDLPQALSGADCVLAAVPAQTLRAVLTDAAPLLPREAPLVLCAKGIERDTGLLLSAVAQQVAPGHLIAALSGPSFATDVARGLPTAVVIAAAETGLAAELSHRFSTGDFRCYSSNDLIGVEIGGALKNVFAIAAGAVTGAGLGASAQAAMVTRGFVELRRIAESFGADPETLMGLSGLGDLILTCSTVQSRNFSYGAALGRGDSLDGLPLAEGVATSGIAAAIAAQRGVEAPIISAVAAILDRAMTVREAVVALMNRPLKSETE